MMKNVLMLAMGAFFVALVMTSCSEGTDSNLLSDVEVENFTDGDTSEDSTLKSRRNGRKGGKGDKGRSGSRLFDNECFEVQFPISVTLGDATEEYADSDALKEAIEAFREEGGSKDEVAISFPIQVENSADEIVEVADQDALKELASECKGSKEGRSKCISLVYPITIEFENGTTVEIEDRQARRQAIRDYVSENGKPSTKPSLVYPITVTIESTGEEVEVADQDALEVLKESCDSDN